MKYAQVKERVLAGAEARFEPWESLTKKIRKGTLADYDHINYPNIENQVILDCPGKACDSPLCIYSPTSEELTEGKWAIIE